MAVKRARPVVIGSIHAATEAALRKKAGGKRGALSAIMDAALRADLGLPAVDVAAGGKVAA